MDEALSILNGPSWEELLKRATLRLDVYESGTAEPTRRGTGFFVTPNTVATCAHVISDSPNALPERITGVDSSGRVLELHAAERNYFRDGSGLDVALLTVWPWDDLSIENHVLSNSRIVLGDEIWAFGHPVLQFRHGDSASFKYVGESKSGAGANVRLRLYGSPVGDGFSGSPAVNVRTGAVVGMLSISNRSGSAHLVPISEIVSRLDVADIEPPLGWLEGLDDEQLRQGGWAFPSQKVRKYVDLVASVRDSHPYSCLIPGVQPPPLATIYVTQRAVWFGSNLDPIKLAPKELLGLEGLLFISAPPGGGKSSLLRRLSAEVCERFAERDYSLVPIRVRAADLAIERPLPELLAASVQRELVGAGAAWKMPTRIFRRRPLPNGRWIVLVDGLDEIVDRAIRQLVIDRLQQLAKAGASEYRFVVTSRPVGSVVETDVESGVGQFSLLSFDHDQLVDCVRAWFETVGLDASNSADAFVEQLDAMGLAGMARNPLMLSMLCQVATLNDAGPIPSSRYELYSRFTDAVSLRQYESGLSGIRAQLSIATERFGADAEIAAEHLLAACDGAIKRLAFERSRGERRATVELMMDWMRSVFPDRLPRGIWRDLVQEILRRSGMLIDEGEDLNFLHGTLADFLAASYVEANSDIEELEYSRVFGPDRVLDVDAEMSYLRFVFAKWRHRTGFTNDVIALIDKDPMGASRLVAACVTDGNSLTSGVIDNAVRRLMGLALAAGVDESQKRSAAVGILQLRPEEARSILERMAHDADSSSMRIWALNTIAGSLEGRPAATAAYWEAPDEELGLGPVLWRLAQLPGREGVRLVGRLASGGLRSHDDVAVAVMVLESHGINSDERVRESLARIGTPEWRTDAILQPLLRSVGVTHPAADLSVIERAYVVANETHLGQRRRSGDAYITHPLGVATILAQLGMTPTTVAAALLHDTVEDTPYSLEALRRDFGDEIAMLVDGVTKLDKIAYGQAAEAETVRRMVVARARDIRALVIKLADRLHNARTWRFVSQEAAQRKAKETLEIYAPLAHRLGMNTIKCELEDLAFQALYPKVYDETVRLVAERIPAREEYLAKLRTSVEAILSSHEIEAIVTGRAKHYYAVYQKMIVQGRDFEQIHDLVGVRVLVDSVRDCYAALEELHAHWKPMRGSFDDYIATPKFNMYESLHSVVIGPGGKPVEIQIRTHTMHRRAEYGVAAHWRYREEPGGQGVPAGGVQARDGQTGPVNDMAWLRQLLDWQKETADPGEFLESLRFEITATEVYAFSPKGQLFGLPAGSTPVDFAYAVHTEVGHRCIGARVNGRIVPLESRLDNGDVVEVLTSKADSAGPSADWLDFVKSRRARKGIRLWLSKKARQGTTSLDEGATGPPLDR